MKPQHALALTRAFGKSVVAGLLVLLLFISALAASHPSLHEWLHKEHQSPTHYCLASLLDHGHGDAAESHTSVADVPRLCVPLVGFVETFVSSHSYFLPPARGPPSLS